MQRKCDCGGSSGIAGPCEECRGGQLRLQRTANRAESLEEPLIVDHVMRSSGQPLDANARAFFEPRFGHDFSTVRIHTDSKAAESAAAVNALAYTVGQHIVFAGGQYSPASKGGRHLFAHELAHVVQDPTSPYLRKQTQEASTHPTEMAAESEADRVAPDGIQPGPDLESLGDPSEAAQEDQDGPIDEFRKVWGEEIANLKRGFRDHRYGCWCGPGNNCENGDPECACCDKGDYSCCAQAWDTLDECCCVHDKDFPEDQVYSETPAPGKVSMWSAEGFEKTMEADERLLSCLQTAQGSRHPTAGALYRAIGLGLFATRVAIGRWIRLRSRVKSGVKAIGSGLRSGVKVVGRGIASAAESVWSGLKWTGRAIGKGVATVGSAIADSAQWIWAEVKLAAAAIGRTAASVQEAIVSAAKATGRTAAAVWVEIRNIAAVAGTTILNFLSCLTEGSRGLLAAILEGPYKICRFPTKEQLWLIPIGWFVGALLGQPQNGAIIGALIPLLFHCVRELPGLKSLIGWVAVEKGGEDKRLKGRLIKDPCIAADDGDINLEVVPCVGSEGLFTIKPGSQAEDEPKVVECELPYGEFLDKFADRPRGGDYVEIYGKWVKDVGHHRKGELHPFHSLKIISPCDLHEPASE